MDPGASPPWVWQGEDNKYSPIDPEIEADSHSQVLTILSRLWFASVGCLLQILGGSKPVVTCSLTTANSAFGVKKRKKEKRE